MENKLLQYYINAIDSILEEKKLLSEVEYNYVYRLVYSKYKSLRSMAEALERVIDKKMSKHFNVVELFESKLFSEEEKQIIVNYWVSSSFANAANKKKISKETLFLKIVIRDYERLSFVLSKKQYTDEDGVIYNGSYIFGSIKKKADAQEALNEFSWAAAGKIALEVGVWMGIDALSPKIAKKVPGICSVVRKCAEEYPTASKIVNYTISPLDIDAFVEQDKINKGENVEGEGEGDEEQEDGAYEDDGENFDDYEVVMEDGKLYDEYEDEVILDTESPNFKGTYEGTFTDDDGTVFNYTIEDRTER